MIGMIDPLDAAARFSACPYVSDDPDEILARADLRVEAGIRRVSTYSADERLIFDLALALVTQRAQAKRASRPAAVPPELRTAAATLDGHAIVAEAAMFDLERAGIPAPTLQNAVTHYRDEAARLRGGGAA